MTTVKRWSILLWCALPVLAITGGYRFFNFDVTHDTYGRVNIDQKGAQLGLAFRL